MIPLDKSIFRMIVHISVILILFSFKYNNKQFNQYLQHKSLAHTSITFITGRLKKSSQSFDFLHLRAVRTIITSYNSNCETSEDCLP